MSKVVIFTIASGNFEEGFPVTLRIREENGNVYKEETGQLPAAPDIPRLYNDFQQNYNNLDAVRRVIGIARGFDIDPNQTTNVSTPAQCRAAGKALEDRLIEWFEHPSIGQLRIYVEEEVSRDETARIIFQTNDELLKKLPWHLWRLFQNRRRAWLSLGARYNLPSEPLKTPVKILAILGNDDGINVQTDVEILTNLPGSMVETLRQPTRQQLGDKLRNSSWDILCFAGHSSSLREGNDGVIQLNNIDSPSLRDLRNAFTRAKENGLKLAIFNSCDGLGLASKLTELGIPQVIVMREPVPDEVASYFLKEFLRLFSRGEKFHLAVRKAQEKLEDMENLYPYASWLPVICQNPAERSLQWRQPFHVRIQRGIKRLWRSHKVAIFVGLILAGALLLFLIKQIFLPSTPTQPTPVPSSITQTLVPSPSPISTPSIDKNIDNLFSRGEKILLKNKSNTNKENGIIAFKNGEWDKATNEFRNSLKQTPNDPESLIYLNNAIVAANAAAKEGQDDIIQIAVSVPITSKLDTAEEILRGVAHAQSKLNCGSVDEMVQSIKNNQTPTCTGTINNRQLQLKIVDDGNNLQTTTQVARKLVNDNNQQNILAVIGHYRSELTKAAVNLVYKDKILVISPTSTSTQLSSLPDTVLRTVTSDSIAVANLNQYILKKIPSTPIKAVVAYDAGESYSESIKDKFRQVTNQQDIPPYDLKTFDAKQIINEARQKNANVLLLAPSGTEDVLNKALEVVKEVSKIQNNNLILLGTSTLYDSAITRDKDFGFASEKTNLITAVPWHRIKSNFEREALQIWGTEKINWLTVMSYDAVQVIIQGLSNITGQPTPTSLRNNILSNLNIFKAEGATAAIQFYTQQEKGSRKPIRDNGLGVLVKVQCLNSSCDFIEEKM
ncbi:extracellular ligand-binding receptor [Calothrix sp. NIES-4071]|nr:extracellular ligand-binding receptor [Calothrix sp. NIES-4071]BAZ63680.1 extracellular ligand-binding receptor [Calothrix sp. NIES-4105]